MPTFSVVIPTYNRAHLLPRCLGSVLAQSCSDFELIVSDDGSRDGTRELVREFAERDTRVRYVYQENRGAGDARNFGASVSRGKFLTFLDSDDEVLPVWLERFAASLADDRVAIVCCGCSFVDRDSMVCSERLPDAGNGSGALNRGYFFTGTFAVRQSVFHDVGGYTPGLPANQHSEFRMRLLPYCDRMGWHVEVVSECLVRRHSHDGPNIRGNVRAVYQSGLYVMEHHSDLLRHDSRSYADWSAAIGGCAAKLGDFPEARRWFLKAILGRPSKWKNYFRLALALTPVVRARVWGRAESQERGAKG